MDGRTPRRLSRQDHRLLRNWNAELADVEVPADLGGEGLDMAEVVPALTRVAIHRTAAEWDPGIAQVLVTVLRASDEEHARLAGLAPEEVDPEETELAAVRRHLAVLLAAVRDQGYWAVGRVSVPQWVHGRLGVGDRGAVRSVAAALEDTADAEPATFAEVLDDRDVPALVWLLAGFVALGGCGESAWLGRLEC